MKYLLALIVMLPACNPSNYNSEYIKIIRKKGTKYEVVTEPSVPTPRVSPETTLGSPPDAGHA